MEAGISFIAGRSMPPREGRDESRRHHPHKKKPPRRAAPISLVGVRGLEEDHATDLEEILTIEAVINLCPIPGRTVNLLDPPVPVTHGPSAQVP